jgi:hypothetical protein
VKKAPAPSTITPRLSPPNYKRRRFNTLKIQKKVGAISRALVAFTASDHRTGPQPNYEGIEINMKKLTTLFAVAALATAIGAAGCKKKGDGESAPKTDEAAKPDDKMAKPDDKMAKPDDKMAKPDDKKPDDKAAPAAGGGDIPAECNDYKAAMEKLASCDKMPQATKDAMKQGYDAMSAGWANAAGLPAEAKKAMADGCKQGADALMQSGKALCGW